MITASFKALADYWCYIPKNQVMPFECMNIYKLNNGTAQESFIMF